MKLQSSLKSLILEIASIESVIDAIKNKRVMGTSYDGDEPGGKGQRLIEPVCVGVSKAGNRVVRAWEREGASHTATIGSQPLPGWRLFRLDKILTYLPQGDNFIEVRPNYNPNGDRSMTRVILNAVFDNTPNTDNVENIDNTENIE
jgi:predicted DNA-binding transcriptional regulator YafY